MQQDSVLRYFDQISAPYLFLMGVLAVICVFTLMSSAKMRWIAFVPLLWFASLARPDELPWWDITMTQPLQMLSTYSRLLTMGVLHVLVAGLLFAPRGDRKHVVNGAMVMLFVLEMAFSLKLVASGVAFRGILSGYTYILIFFAFVFGLSRMLQSAEDCYKALQVYLAAVALIVLGTLFEVAFHPTGVVANSRLFATTANPQAAGTIFAFALPPITVIVSRRQSGLFSKPVLIALAGIVGVFMLWTGSRTAALAAVVGLGVLFRHKLATSAIVLVLIAGCTYGLMQMTLFEGSQGAAERLLNTTNTRAEPWRVLIDDFLSNPALGKTLTSGSTRESSILGTASNLGVVGLAILGGFFFYLAKLCLQLVQVSKRMPEHAQLANAIVGGFAAMGVAWVFDGYLYGVATIHVFFLYLYLAIGACLVEVQGYAPQAVTYVWYTQPSRAEPA